MGKAGTWAAAGAVAAGLAAVGVGIDARSGTRPLATVAGLAGAAAYLAATLLPGVRLFGRSAQVDARVNEFALTFDDGPDPRYTPEIAGYSHPVVTGRPSSCSAARIREHPELAVLVVADGTRSPATATTIASSRSHRLRGTPAARGDRGSRVPRDGPVPAPLFRPPHGVRSPWLTAQSWLRPPGLRLGRQRVRTRLSPERM